jgi:diaminopimelate epimerase
MRGNYAGNGVRILSKFIAEELSVNKGLTTTVRKTHRRVPCHKL